MRSDSSLDVKVGAKLQLRILADVFALGQCEPIKPKLSLVGGSPVLKVPTVEESVRDYENNLLTTKPKI
jgi:hypothetical protein